jgi:hypothetical protein
MRSKPAFKLLVIMALLLVTIFALIQAFSSAAVQQTPVASDKTQDLFSLLQKSNFTVTKIFSQFQSDGKTIPQASLNEYAQALALTEESRSLFQAGNYPEANSKIIQALQEFREAVRIVYTTFPEQPTETEASVEKTVQLKSSINRYQEQLGQIENLIMGYDTSIIKDNIQTLQFLLGNALNNTDQMRFEAALTNLAEAKTIGEQLLSSLKSLASNLNIQRIATYINQTETRLANIREKAESLSNTNSLTALNNAETSLGNAKQYLESQRINDTLNELAISKASEEEAVKYLKSTASSVDSTSDGTSNAIESP